MVPTVDGYREMKVVTAYDTSYAKEALAENLYYHALFAEPMDYPAYEAERYHTLAA